MLVGRGGLGKSTLTVDLAAQISRGAFGSPGRVLIASAEDSRAHTMVPRLIAAEADRTNVGFLDLVGHDLTSALDAMRDHIAAHGVTMLVLDPLNAFLGGAVDSHRDKDLRVVLGPLAELAEETGCAVVCIGHVNKATTGDAYTALSGSIAYFNTARSVLIVAADPEADEDDATARVLVHAKCNLGPLAAPHRFAVVPAHVEVEGDRVPFSRVEWGDEAPHLSVSDAIAGVDEDERSKAEDAAEWLTDHLSLGAALAKDVKAAAEADGIARRTLERAAKRLAIDRRRRGERGPFEWCLPPNLATTSPTRETWRGGEVGDERAAPCAAERCAETSTATDTDGIDWCATHAPWNRPDAA